MTGCSSIEIILDVELTYVSFFRKLWRNRSKPLLRFLSSKGFSKANFQSAQVVLVSLGQFDSSKAAAAAGILCGTGANANKKDWVLFQQMLNAVMDDLKIRLKLEEEHGIHWEAALNGLLEATPEWSTVQWLQESCRICETAFDTFFFMKKPRSCHIPELQLS